MDMSTPLSRALNQANRAELSQHEIHRRMEASGYRISNATVSKYMNGTHGEPRYETLAAFSEVLGVSLDDLRLVAGQQPIGAAKPFSITPEAALLNESQRAVVESMIAVMLEQNKRVAELESNQEYEHSRARDSQSAYGLAAFEQGLGDGIGPDDVPEDS